MARYSENPRDKIDQVVDDWRTRCLIGDESLTQEDVDAWTPARVDDLYERFNGSQLVGSLGGGTFDSKWTIQLEGAASEVRLLAAELLLIHFLFASSITKSKKLAVASQSLSGTPYEFPEGTAPVLALKQNIGHPGIGFNTRRDVQVGYLIDFVRRLKALPADDRRSLLDSSWDLRDFAEDTEEPRREMRHVLLHLLRPEDFERISSGTHKREIGEAFKELAGDDPPDDVDERLLAIRKQLEEYLPEGNANDGAIDFYHPPLHSVWRSGLAEDGEGAGDLESLEWKKQIVLYGPPGTSKTYQARALATSLVMRAALKAWGPEAFFSRQAELAGAEGGHDGLVQDSIVWLQLHPAFGYEEFIRGLRLTGDKTTYTPGALPKFVDHLEHRSMPDGLPRLPGVLVLDEINRTNLSEMLGEAFSLLERDKRGEEVELPGFDPDQEPDVLVIPEDLYVIGTMNEIDQSVETLDFALRRRFLWRECPFERETLLEIIRARWDDDVRRFTFDDAADQLQLFADNAQSLNDAIADSQELGRQYQVGHTYFADIAFFLGVWLASRKNKPANGSFLWTSAKGTPQPPLKDLWSRSLRPLLEQYLAASEFRDTELTRLRDNFLTRP